MLLILGNYSCESLVVFPSCIRVGLLLDPSNLMRLIRGGEDYICWVRSKCAVDVRSFYALLLYPEYNWIVRCLVLLEPRYSRFCWFR